MSCSESEKERANNDGSAVVEELIGAKSRVEKPKFGPVEPSPLLHRLKTFLPQMAEANSRLEGRELGLSLEKTNSDSESGSDSDQDDEEESGDEERPLEVCMDVTLLKEGDTQTDDKALPLGFREECKKVEPKKLIEELP